MTGDSGFADRPLSEAELATLLDRMQVILENNDRENLKLLLTLDASTRVPTLGQRRRISEIAKGKPKTQAEISDSKKYKAIAVDYNNSLHLYSKPLIFSLIYR
jgi:hypothetical protein